MPRGRPRKVPVEEVPLEVQSIQLIIAKVLAEYCGIPGCMPKHHMDEAAAILRMLKNGGYEVINVQVSTA